MTAQIKSIAGEQIDVREPAPPRFVLKPFNSLTLGSERAYLVKGLIPRTGIIVVWGPPKCGKSFWTYDLAMHVALGWEYRGRRVHKGAVVYCAFEGADGFRARAEGFRQRHLAEDAPDIEFYLVAARANMAADHADLIAAIRSQLSEKMPVAVVLDTLNRSMAGSENDDKDMGAYVRAADAIREAFQCAVIIVHHCGVEGSRPRGHTSLTGAADAQLAVKRDAAGNILVTVEWMKDGPEGDSIASRLESVEVGTDADDEPISSCVVVEAEASVVRTPSSRWSKGLRIVHEAITAALLESGINHQVQGDGPMVRAVSVDDARAAHDTRYLHHGEGDRAEAERKAWSRNLKAARDLNLIGNEMTADGRSLLWLLDRT